MKIVYIKWLDSCETLGWLHKNTGNAGLSTIQSVGYLMQEDKKQIQIARCKGEDDTYAGILTVPKAAIVERKMVKL